MPPPDWDGWDEFRDPRNPKKRRFPMRLAPGMRNTDEPPVIYRAGRRSSRET